MIDILCTTTVQHLFQHQPNCNSALRCKYFSVRKANRGTPSSQLRLRVHLRISLYLSDIITKMRNYFEVKFYWTIINDKKATFKFNITGFFYRAVATNVLTQQLSKSCFGWRKKIVDIPNVITRQSKHENGKQ